jgi:translation initiation factor IF-1
MAAVTLAVALLVQDGEASIFSSRRLSATPKWFSGVQKVARKSQLSERATVVRGGAAPGDETADEAHADSETVVEAQDLYLPGLLDTIITRTNKVCSVVSGRIHRLLPCLSFPSCSPPCSFLHSFIVYL